jgi:hypothetical protein
MVEEAPRRQAVILRLSDKDSRRISVSRRGDLFDRSPPKRTTVMLSVAKHPNLRVLANCILGRRAISGRQNAAK